MGKLAQFYITPKNITRVETRGLATLKKGPRTFEGGNENGNS
jgi:hypothetical protein